MSIKLAFLGTGTCNSTPRNPPALAMSDGKEVILIDCGGGCYHQLGRMNDDHFRYDAISTILLTHFHVDHLSGLADLIWGEMWDSRGPRTEPITIVGPGGLANIINNRIIPFIGNYPISFKINPIEIADGELYKGSFFTAQAFKVAHGDTAVGYIFTTGSKKLAVTGDTGFCENLVTILSRSDIAVMEWSNSGYSKNPSHISMTDIEQLINLDILPPQIYITHMYLSPGRSFDEQVLLNRKSLGKIERRFIFPRDMETITIE